MLKITEESNKNLQEMEILRKHIISSTSSQNSSQPDPIFITIGNKVKKMSSSTQEWFEEKFLQLYQDAKKIEQENVEKNVVSLQPPSLGPFDVNPFTNSLYQNSTEMKFY